MGTMVWLTAVTVGTDTTSTPRLAETADAGWEARAWAADVTAATADVALVAALALALAPPEGASGMVRMAATLTLAEARRSVRKQAGSRHLSRSASDARRLSRALSS